MMVLTRPEGQLAPRNPSRVPGVVGMTVPQAIGELRRSNYGCAVAREKDRQGAGRVRRIVAQSPRSGSKGSESQLVRLAVSEPFSSRALPPGCVDQRGKSRAEIIPPG